ncbi:ABC-2 transporter permease [Roseateles asaccharophilus]|uniref:ABC-type transport system involved in multi-copper enzyme maturation permease subunit n=1 Tax=Roseateles asaccharophilus TaxID=582607 RepID=A0ABU2A6B3_9BURK|nr:ABC-2 transporter permease [Roseateles asaccharophilus]MDR7332709.1 ABC-type transport system involved in multi-copper enzyme maturation permease subunit [Roseateles asaccharophilus]
MNTLTAKLIAKELHQYRWMMAGATAAGLAALPMAASSKTGFHIAFIVWVTAVIALAVMLAIYGVGNERKERARLFVLSLPLSPRDYVRIKVLGLFACFFGPWLALSLGAATLILVAPDVPDGLLPYTVLMCVYLLLNFALVLCAALHIASEGAMGGVIIVTNMSVSLFLSALGHVPDIGTHMQAAEPVWNTAFWLILALELGATALALTLPLLVAARRRDFL